MKKMLLLLVSGLLLVCMAGSAVATSTDLIPNSIVTVYPDSTGDVTLNVAAFPAGSYNLKLDVSGANIEASIVDPTDAFTLSGAIPGNPAQRSVYIDGSHQATIRIHRISGTQVGAVTVSFEDVNHLIRTDTVQVSSETVQVNAPEFPTVALPVAAVIGLVFIFGRRKEGL